MITQRCTAHDAGTDRSGRPRGRQTHRHPDARRAWPEQRRTRDLDFAPDPTAVRRPAAAPAHPRGARMRTAAAWEVLDRPGSGDTPTTLPDRTGSRQTGLPGFDPVLRGRRLGATHGTTGRTVPQQALTGGPGGPGRVPSAYGAPNGPSCEIFVPGPPSGGRGTAVADRDRSATGERGRAGARMPRADSSVPEAASISSRRGRSLRPSRHRRRTSRGRDRRNRGRHRPSRRR